MDTILDTLIKNDFYLKHSIQWESCNIKYYTNNKIAITFFNNYELQINTDIGEILSNGLMKLDGAKLCFKLNDIKQIELLKTILTKVFNIRQ